MTRAELEQVRAALNRIGGYVDQVHVLLPTSLHKAEAMGECASAAEALAILDAELAKPEAREWRVVPLEVDGTKMTPSCVMTEEEARGIRINPAYRVIEFRTPAGPWEPLEVKV